MSTAAQCTQPDVIRSSLFNDVIRDNISAVQMSAQCVVYSILNIVVLLTYLQ